MDLFGDRSAEGDGDWWLLNWEEPFDPQRTAMLTLDKGQVTHSRHPRMDGTYAVEGDSVVITELHPATADQPARSEVLIVAMHVEKGRVDYMTGAYADDEIGDPVSLIRVQPTGPWSRAGAKVMTTGELAAR